MSPFKKIVTIQTEVRGRLFSRQTPLEVHTQTAHSHQTNTNPHKNTH